MKTLTGRSRGKNFQSGLMPGKLLSKRYPSKSGNGTLITQKLVHWTHKASAEAKNKSTHVGDVFCIVVCTVQNDDRVSYRSEFNLP